MGERQTTFVIWTWMIATLGFFVLIGYRLWEQGPEWLWRSSESLTALGIIALSAYVAAMLSQIFENQQKEAKQRERDHQADMEATRVSSVKQTAELMSQLREVESAVYGLAHKIGT